VNADDPKPEPVYKKCLICGERYDEQKDPWHLDQCRDSVKP
jgi:hypothetical protein